MFDDNECPLCVSPFPENEKWFKPCPCGFRVCIWCWHTILKVAAESETIKYASCPGCREPLDVQVLLKQRPKKPEQKRPPRRSHASKTALSDLVINDGRNVAIRGLPLELFSLYSTSRSAAIVATQTTAATMATSSNNNITHSNNSKHKHNHNNSNNSSLQPSAPEVSLQELLSSQTWFGQYGRIVSCCASQVTGAVVIRYFNADDAQHLVNSLTNTNNDNSNGSKIFSASLLDTSLLNDEEDEEQDKNNKNTKKKQQGRANNDNDNNSKTNKLNNTNKDLVLSCSSKISASIVPTRYCSSFLRNEECKRPFCVELHHQVSTQQQKKKSSSSTSTAPAVEKDLFASELNIYGNDYSILGSRRSNKQGNANNNASTSTNNEEDQDDEEFCRYYTSEKEWSADLVKAMKVNSPEYFSSPVVQNLMERRLKSTFDSVFQILNNNKGMTTLKLSFHQKRALQQLPLVFPVIPSAGKDRK